MSQAPLLSTEPSTVNKDNVQGDILLGLPKKKEEFIFFCIQDPAKFKAALSELKIASTTDVEHAHEAIDKARRTNPSTLIPLPLLNIAFSQHGLNALGIKDDIGDMAFSHGQLADAQALGDPGTTTNFKFDPNWAPAFKSPIDSVLLAAGESWKTVGEIVDSTLETLGSSIKVVYTLKGSVRPGKEDGHEHFGWQDGISNPVVEGVQTALPGQRVIPPGVLLLGASGDPVRNRPSWAKEGSFLVFRQLQQLVPEFHDFLDKNPIILPGLDRKAGSELLGARLFGRWKSGAPTQLAPLKDDLDLANDPLRNNHFIFPQHKGEAGQLACPYAAHIRKSNPRNDLDPLDVTNTDPINLVTKMSITRAGIPYGPEVTPAEDSEKLTAHERGLAFVSYQSALLTGLDINPLNSKGFRFIQRTWCNNIIFPPKLNDVGLPLVPGFDPIVGQEHGKPRETLGTDIGPALRMPRDFVASNGGEYFFSPSISALKTTFAGISE